MINLNWVVNLAEECGRAWDKDGKTSAKQHLKNRASLDGLRIALRDGNTVQRRKALFLMSLSEEPRVAIGELAKSLQNDECPVVRHEAAHFLGETQCAEAVAPLVSALTSDPVDLVRQEAAEALGELASQEATGPLSEACDDPSDAVVRTARIALLQIATSEELGS